MMNLVLGLAAWWTLGYLAGCIFAHRGYPPQVGVVFGMLLGPIGLVIALLLPRTRSGRRQSELEQEIKKQARADSARKTCPMCQRDVSVIAPVCPRCNHRFAI